MLEFLIMDRFGSGRGVRGVLACCLICCLGCYLGGCSALPSPHRVVFADAATFGDGYLYLPGGAGPHPVVIDLHGCNGIWRKRNRVWLPRLTGAGFAVLQVDSLTRRGVSNICDDGFRVSPMTRSMDVAAAVRQVMRDRRFDRDGVFLLGMSHGATTSLLTQLHPDSVFSQLKGVIAFYPYCYGTLPVLNADLLVLIGARDDWTPAARCRDMRIGNRAGHTYELVVYPDAYHSFDIPGQNSIYYGHRVQYNAAAAEDGARRVMRFLNERRPDQGV